MTGLERLGVASSLLLFCALPDGVLAQQAGSVPAPPPPAQPAAPALEGPITELEPIPSDEPTRPRARATLPAPAPAQSADADDQWSHDASTPAKAPQRAKKVYVKQAPPAPVAERPARRRENPRAIWIPGYWDWDAGRGEFTWIAGLWQVPPRGMIWIGSRWMRDQNGWYRLPGYWSERRGAREQLPTPTASTRRRPAWQTNGPPADHPADNPAPAPGADYFFVAGHYEPTADGSVLTWKPGFWAREESGWEWVPARWVRRPSGWEYRPGDWVRQPEPTDLRVTIEGAQPARPGAAAGAPGADSGAVESTVEDDFPAAPLPGDDDQDRVAESERQPRTQRPVVVVPGPGMPVYVIRPPGYYPYGPGGVMVPAVVPRFVRRILNEVLP